MRVQRFLVMAVVVLAVGVAAAAAGAQTSPQAPQRVDEPKKTNELAHLMEIQAKIEKIDLDTREVTLRTPADKVMKVEVGPAVQRLSELEVGDEVSIQYYESLTLGVSALRDGDPSQHTAASVLRNKDHELPGGVTTHETTITAKVTAIDAAMVTLLGPDGDSVSLEVEPDVLEKLAVGDLVSAVYTEALAVSVTRSRKP